MNAAEHSTMVFLLLAVEKAPEKARDMLTLSAMQSGASAAFLQALGRLTEVVEDHSALLKRSAEMRRELRDS